jgi:hypothetical protein
LQRAQARQRERSDNEDSDQVFDDASGHLPKVSRESSDAGGVWARVPLVQSASIDAPRAVATRPEDPWARLRQVAIVPTSRPLWAPAAQSAAVTCDVRGLTRVPQTRVAENGAALAVDVWARFVPNVPRSSTGGERRKLAVATTALSRAGSRWRCTRGYTTVSAAPPH